MHTVELLTSFLSTEEHNILFSSSICPDISFINSSLLIAPALEEELLSQHLVFLDIGLVMRDESFRSFTAKNLAHMLDRMRRAKAIVLYKGALMGSRFLSKAEMNHFVEELEYFLESNVKWSVTSEPFEMQDLPHTFFLSAHQVN